MEALAKTFDTIDFSAIAESISNAAKGIDELVNSSDLHEAVEAFNDTFKGYGQLASSLDGHAAQLAPVVAATMVDIRHLVKTVNGQIAPMATGIADTATEVRMTLSNLDDRLQPVMQNLEASTASARDAFQQVQTVLENLAHLSNEDSALLYRLDDTLTQLSKAAGSLALLAEYLSRHPEALLQGKAAARGDQ
jgi:paraquat-inducible protein B